tara:strand:- start:2964 stop:4214 length:1251 start_codon:yes stop_codon:yes gene_type:complete
MYIFKFGGASIKDASGVKNLVNVLQQVGYDDVLLVISAMGKMTNAFEKLTNSYVHKSDELPLLMAEVKAYHYTIAEALFVSKNHPVYDEMDLLFREMNQFMIQNKSKNYSYVYDQLVSFAELFSTKIVSHYLTHVAIENTWLDVRELIVTDSYYRDAKVDWQQTEQRILSKVNPEKLIITQGFIASDGSGTTTTLGREGSDYTAAIFAYCLNATSVTIWKDVEGVLNADPRYFKETSLLQQISYTEAIELAFYGASVIHPKTLQPLQKKEIPLYVKSFVKPKLNGTKVSRGVHIFPEIPCFIVKKNQLLLSISTLDFSFIVERNISEVFSLLHNCKMKVNVIQNSAISFSICLEDKYNKFDDLLKALKGQFKIDFIKGVSLFTIRHFTIEAIEKIEKDNLVLLKQLTKETVQIVIK